MKLVPAFHDNARAVAFASTVWGRLVLSAVYAGGLCLHSVKWWLPAGLITGIIAVAPKHRRLLLAIASVVWALTFVPFDWNALDHIALAEASGISAPWARSGIILTALALALLVRGAIRLLSLRADLEGGAISGWVQKHPILTLLLFDIALLGATRHLPLPDAWRVAAFAVAMCFGRYLWFIAISLLDREGRSPRKTGLRFGSWLPFWIGTATTITPVPKNGAALRKIEAKDDRELAVTMWKGVQLLAWSLVLTVLLDLLTYALHGEVGRFTKRLPWLPHLLDLPLREDLFESVAGGGRRSPTVMWTVVLGAFFEELLRIAAWGHTMIAGARIVGFRALRNTWRPLQARSIADFWNRYFFYFKELLVDVFFYPTFLRWFKGRPRMRLFFATVIAAGFGNFLYHFLKEFELIAEFGLFGALLRYRAYAIYGLVLGAAIGVSQLRDRRAAKHWSTPLFIWVFYALVMVTQPTRPLSEHLRFFAALIGINVAP